MLENFITKESDVYVNYTPARGWKVCVINYTSIYTHYAWKCLTFDSEGVGIQASNHSMRSDAQRMAFFILYPNEVDLDALLRKAQLSL